MVAFWRDIIFLLYEEDSMESLIIRLIELVNNEEVNRERRLLASLWVSTLAYSFLKLDVAHKVSRMLEQRNLPPRAFENRVREETDRAYPDLKNVPWLNLLYTVLPCFTDKKFVLNILSDVNEFSVRFIAPIVELASPRIGEKEKQLLVDLARVYTTGETSDKGRYRSEEIFTLKDTLSVMGNHDEPKLNNEDSVVEPVAGERIRNDHWKLAAAAHNWCESPIGLLPWQDDLKSIDPTEATVVRDAFAWDSETITPGIVDRDELRTRSQTNWDCVLRKKKRLSRRQERRNATSIMRKAMETVKKRK